MPLVTDAKREYAAFRNDYRRRLFNAAEQQRRGGAVVRRQGYTVVHPTGHVVTAPTATAPALAPVQRTNTSLRDVFRAAAADAVLLSAGDIIRRAVLDAQKD